MASTDVRVESLGDSIVGNTWFLSGFRINAEEITDVVQCFGDEAYIYAMGSDKDRCRLTMTFVVMTGRKCVHGGSYSGMDAVEKGIAAYGKGRISMSTNPGTVTIGKMSKSGWLVGIEVSGRDLKAGVCTATVEFILEMKRELGGKKK